MRERSDGSSDLGGHLDPELTALLRAQLSAFSTPDPAVDGAPDRRTAGQLDWSGPLSVEAARRLACDAQTIPIVLGARGRAARRRSVLLPRHPGDLACTGGPRRRCAFAGCDCPPEWTEAHHRTHWADGGETSVANCCLLCDHHHRRVHHDGWSLELVDEVIHTIPPAWVDPDRTPRPNDNRRTMTTRVGTGQGPDDADPDPP